jgi:hypothetical protein
MKEKKTQERSGKKLDNRLLSKKKKYGDMVEEVLRLLRNKEHHFDEVPEDLRVAMGNRKTGILRYFLSFFPRLLMQSFLIFAKHYCSPGPLLSEDLEYLKQPVHTSKATILIPELDMYFKNFSMCFLISVQGVDP